MPFLYEIAFPNGKRYIGIANKPQLRWSDHENSARRGTSFPLYDAMRSFGVENIEFRVLVEGSRDYVRALEIEAIKTLKTRVPFGYNLTHGGEIAPSSAPEVAEAIRASKFRHWADPEYRAGMSAKIKGRKMTPEQVRKIGEAKRLHWDDPAFRVKLVAAHTGKKQSPETLARKSASLKKAYAEGRGVESRRAAMTGRTWANNGVEHAQFLSGQTIPDGWSRGMLKKGPR